MMMEEKSNRDRIDTSKPSFREIVAGSSHWFQEAGKIIEVSREWEEEYEEPPQYDLVVTFPKQMLIKLKIHGT